MKSILFVLLLSFSISTLADKKCYGFNTKKLIKKVDFFQVQKFKNNRFNIKTKIGENTFNNTYICYLEKKHYKCIGDDDSGRFILNITENVATIRLAFLNLGEPDGKKYSIKPQREKLIAGAKVNCK
jgi:hypothetical protein